MSVDIPSKNAFIDYYDLLDINPNADAQHIRIAFLQKAKEHHPDAGGSTEYMQQLTAAYRTLKDGKSKTAYDMMHNFHTGTTKLSDYTYDGNNRPKDVNDMSDDQIDTFLDSLYNEYRNAPPATKESLWKRIIKSFV